MATNWKYYGDVNLHYGGFFADLSDVKHGYASVVRITDLDSSCGFESAVLIEHLVAILDVDSERMTSALKCCGMTRDDLPKKNTTAYWMTLIDCVLSYGLYDPDDGWNNYRSYHSETIQEEKDGPMSFDGWKATVNLEGKSLKNYVRKNHLN